MMDGNDNRYVQYGCGWTAPEGWRNFDSSPTLRFERLPIIGKMYTKNPARFPENVEYGDIVKGLPVPASSTEAIYCSHVLEHLSLEDFRKALKNTHRLLRSGGVFRFVLPDLEYSIKKYVASTSDDAAPNFLKETLLGQETRPRGLKGLMFLWLGNASHLWMWDYKAIVHELEETGFRNIRRASYGDSTNSVFKQVEVKGRWDNCLGVECTSSS